MGQIIRCPLIGVPCSKPITIQEKTFFLAEAEEPDYDKQRRKRAISEAIADGYTIRSALEEKGINAFTCKICEMIQTCAYGMADISQNNANVFMELGMMLALGKPTIILAKRGQEEQLKLPSDVTAIEIIPFEEYLDIIDHLRETVQKLPPAVSAPSPIEDLEKIKPQFAEELKNMGANLVKEFKESIAEAKLDTISPREERKEVPPELDERLKGLEEKLEDMTRLGFATDAETASSRAYYFYNRGKYEEALASLNWVLELEPDDPDTLYNRGTTLVKLERYDDALADFNRSLELRPDHPATLTNRGNTLDRLERYDDALADFNRSLELGPDDPATLNNRGTTLHKLERYDDALADFNRSLELRPDHPATLNNRGTTLHKLERYDDALADFNRSLELGPDGPDTLYNRGTILLKLERYDDALADFNRSLELRPDHPATLYNLACLFSLRGKADDALAYLEKAIDGDKKYREMAKTDKDFDNIRDDPHFKKLVGSD